MRRSWRNESGNSERCFEPGPTAGAARAWPSAASRKPPPIKAAAKSDPVAAGDGAVSLMERIWPAFQDIDTSSGALGTAVARTLAELIPILVDAPADHATRSKWLEQRLRSDGSIALLVNNAGMLAFAQHRGEFTAFGLPAIHLRSHVAQVNVRRAQKYLLDERVA